MRPMVTGNSRAASSTAHTVAACHGGAKGLELLFDRETRALEQAHAAPHPLYLGRHGHFKIVNINREGYEQVLDFARMKARP